MAGATLVTIGSASATGVNVTSQTTLSCVTPGVTSAGGFGAKSVTVSTPNGTATKANGFTYARKRAAARVAAPPAVEPADDTTKPRASMKVARRSR